MKKILLFCIMLGAGASYSQTLIPRVGFVLSNSSFDPKDYSATNDNEFGAGYAIGIAYEFTLSGNLALLPEVDFVRKNFKHTDSFFGDGYEFKTRETYSLNYFEVPVLVKYKFGGDTKFYATGGPTIGIGLSGKYTSRTYFGTVLNYKTEGDIKFKDQPSNYEGNDMYVDNKIDVGITLGAGVIVKRKIVVDARYTHGLTNVDDNFNSKNRTIQLSVGVPLILF